MRYFARIAYKGTNYCGWQSQASDVKTIQQTIEDAIKKISQQVTPIVGCGRTDTGVHALDYFFHFDAGIDWIGKEYQLNAVLPFDISVKKIILVDECCHARFDATSRSYEYHLHNYKDPFLQNLSYHFREPVDLEVMNSFCNILLEYTDFTTFCKSKTDVIHKHCNLTQAKWFPDKDSGKYVFRISSNRFLRGMVRLIVGMCLKGAKDKLTIQELRHALENKIPLGQAWSVPAEGLYLSDIHYPYDEKLKI